MSGTKGKSGKYSRTSKMRESYRRGQLGTKKPWAGKYEKSEEQRKKMSISHIGKLKGKPQPWNAKEKSHLWKGGISTYERKLFLNHQYRARRQKAEGFYTWDEWELLKKQYGFKCPACDRKEPGISLTPDHIIPLSCGGSNYIENIQPLCKSCNCKKHTQIIKYEI